MEGGEKGRRKENIGTEARITNSKKEEQEQNKIFYKRRGKEGRYLDCKVYFRKKKRREEKRAEERRGEEKRKGKRKKEKGKRKKEKGKRKKKKGKRKRKRTFASSDRGNIARLSSDVIDDRLFKPRDDNVGSLRIHPVKNTKDPVVFHRSVPSVHCL